MLAARACDPLDVLRLAFTDAMHGVVVCAADGAIQFVNARAAAIFDQPPADLAGQPLARLLPDALPAGRDSQRIDASLTRRTIDGRRRDGTTVPVEVGLTLFEDGPARFLVASVADITERHELKARLAAATHAHLGFQRIVADVAARVSAIDPDNAGEVIADALRQIGEALQLDCVMLGHWHPDDTLVALVHTWMAPPAVRPEAFTTSSIPFVLTAVDGGEPYAFAAPDELPEPDREAFQCRGFRSGIVVPFGPRRSADPTMSALIAGSMTRRHTWAPAVVERLRLITGVISQAFARCATHHELQEALGEIRRLRDRQAIDTAELRREARVLRTSRPVVSESVAIQQVLAQIGQVANTPATVLLLGETGTGKEVMAQVIHDLSPRHQRQMIRVSCAAIPATLIESELFGREKGAYTGALSRQIGRFEAAHQSTLLLDEIGDLPMEVQVKLLRVLQERVIERLGSTQPVKVDVRIIAATNRNLEDAVRDKTFREDLFYRLNVFPVVVPPLRERMEDIPALVWSFVDEFSRLFGKNIESISKDSLRELQRYSWPGNVRELRNVIERAVIMATGPQLVVGVPRVGERPIPQTAMTLTELEVEHIRAVLKSTGWRVRGSGGAAERLGLKPTTLESRMARLGIARQRAS